MNIQLWLRWGKEKLNSINLGRLKNILFTKLHIFYCRYVGMAILAISKEVMYDFHYNFIHKNFPQTLLGFTDTDSFMYSIPCEEDIYQKLKTLDPEGRWMDFSNYPPGWCENQERNKLIPGKFKDEGAGKNNKITQIHAKC